MRWNDGHDVNNWPLMVVGMVLFWTLLAVVLVLALRWLRDSGAQPADPRRILDERLARGEIQVDDYTRALQALEVRHAGTGPR